MILHLDSSYKLRRYLSVARENAGIRIDASIAISVGVQEHDN